LGYATITHPCHPHYGKSFQILSTRKYSLSLDTREGNALYVPVEWTDRANPTLYDDIPVSERPTLSYLKLNELSELIVKLKKQHKLRVD
jgi:hypothetical protein